MNAHDILARAGDMLTERGRDYDHEGGERSMADAVRAFNAITGYRLSEGDGWLLMDLVKAVRSCHSPGHVDSNLDRVAYAALRAEAECAHIAQGSRCVSDAGLDGKTVAENTNANTDPLKSGCGDEGWIDHDGGGNCPVSDDLLKVDIEYAGGGFYYGFTAASRDWRGVKRWRIAEVDGWVRWSGGPKPLFPANSVFRVVFRNGLAHCHWRPDALNWSHSGSNFDIIAYRPA